MGASSCRRQWGATELALALVLAGLFAGPAAAEVHRLGQRCATRDTGATWPAEIVALRARGGAALSEDAGTIAIALPASSEAYYFTKAGHPAHPAKAHKVISVIENRAVKIHVEGAFNGSKRAFDAWLQRLAEDDRLGVGPD